MQLAVAALVARIDGPGSMHLTVLATCMMVACTGPAALTRPQHSHCVLSYSQPTIPLYALAGMDFYVCLERPGYRVARRRKMKTRVGVQHKVTKDDAIKW